MPDYFLFIVAGLWEKWGDFYTVTMVTCPGNEIVNKYHKAQQMPLILRNEEKDLW